MSNKTEKKLRLLFDYQRFENEPALGRIIEQVEGGITELSDDDLALVNAAGDAWLNDGQNDQNIKT